MADEEQDSGWMFSDETGGITDENVVESGPWLFETDDNEEPLAFKDYLSEWNQLRTSSDFLDRSYDEQIGALREIYLGPNKDGTRNWGEDEEDIVKFHKETAQLIREANGLLVQPEDYEPLLPPTPTFQNAKSVEEVHDLLDAWEEKAVKAGKTQLGIYWDEIEEPATKQIKNKVDLLKRITTAYDFFGGDKGLFPSQVEEDETKEEPGPSLERMRTQVKMDVARLGTLAKVPISQFAGMLEGVPGTIGETAEDVRRWVETNRFLPDLPARVSSDPKVKEADKIDTPFGPISEVALLDGIASTATLIVPAAGLARAAGAIGLTGRAAAGFALAPIMTAGARLSYQEAYEKAYNKTQNSEEAALAGWIATPVGMLDGAVDALIGVGKIPAFVAKLPLKVKQKMLAKLASQGTLGKALRTGFSAAGTAAIESGTEIVQTIGEGAAASIATGENLLPEKEEIVVAGAAGLIGGAAAGGVSASLQANGFASAEEIFQNLIQNEELPAAEKEAIQPKPTEEEPVQPEPQEPVQEEEPVQPEPAEEPIQPEEPVTEEPVEEEPIEQEPAEEPETETSFIEDFPVIETPLEGLQFNAPDIGLEQFKAEGDERGVVEPLEGEFDRLGVAPIIVYETKDGRRVIVSGRHRADLAIRSGEKTIPAQILKESEGFSAQDARIIDAELNIRDQQGTVQDYAKFFKERPLSEDEARARGLTSRQKGKQGFAIGTKATSELFTLHQNKKISDAQAAAIANAAPNDGQLQRLGLQQAQKGSSPELIANILEISKRAGQAERSSQIDMFGAQEFDNVIKLANAATTLRQEAQDTLRTINQAKRLSVKNKAAIESLPGLEDGINIKDPRALERARQALKERIVSLSPESWPLNPEIVQEVKQRAAETLAEQGEQTELPIEEPKTFGMFAGVRARTAPSGLKEAKTAKTPQEGFEKTGWFQGPDKKWRFEIDDSEARIAPNLETVLISRPIGTKKQLHAANKPIFKLKELLDHSQLYEAYPELQDVTVSVRKGAGAEIDDQNNVPVITIGEKEIAAGADRTKTILLHEIQHAIQQIEDFASGGNSESVKRLFQEEFLEKFRKLTPKEQRSTRSINRLKRQLYKELLGEAEARLVSERAQRDPQLKALQEKDLPFLFLDVPSSNLRLTRLTKKGLEKFEPIQQEETEDPETLGSFAEEEIEELGAPEKTKRDFKRTTFSQTELPSNAVPEAVDMARLPPQMQRIQPAPIVPDSEEVKPTKDIIFDGAKSLGGVVQFKGQRKGTTGTYYPGSAKTAIKYQGDLDVTAHELAHFLDSKLGIVAEWAKKRKKSPFDNELIDLFAPFGSATTNSTLLYKRAEGVAEYIRAWIVNPQETEKVAPNFTEYFKKKVPEQVLKDLQAFGEDIRKFAGIKAKDKILANIRWEPLGAFDSLKSLFTGTKANGFEVSAYDKLGKVFTDSLSPYEQAIEFAKEQTGKKSLIPSDDPMLLARNYAGVNSKITYVFENGMIDANNRKKRVTPGGFSWLFEGLDTSSHKKLNQDAKDVATLMVAERTVEKAEQFAKEAAEEILQGRALEELDPEERIKVQQVRQEELSRIDIAGISGGLEADIDTAKQAIKDFQKDPNRYQVLKDAAERYRTWADANLRYLRDSGRLSKEGYDYIKNNNEQYVAMQRIRQIEPGRDLDSVGIDSKTGKIGTIREPIRKMKGSSADIANPYSSLLNATANIMREADRNRIMQAFVDLLEVHRGMYEGEPNLLASVGSKAKSNEPHTIQVWRNGEPEYWRFDKDVFESLKGLQESSKLPTWITVLPQLVKTGIVYAPPFLVRNTARDTFHRLIVSEGSKKESLLETFRFHDSMDYDMLRLYGGDQAGHYLSNEVNFARALRSAMTNAELAKSSLFLNPRKIAEFARSYPKLVRGSEQFNRIREFRAAYKQAKEQHPEWGDEDAYLYAANRARGLLDFAVGGTAIKQLNQVIIFTNPAIQGLRRSIKAAGSDPMGFAVRWSMYVLIPQILTRLLAKAGGYEDELEKMPPYLRDLFFPFKLAEDFWLRIPKPYELGVLGSGIDRAISYFQGNEKAFEGYGGSVARSLLPVDESAFAGPFRGIVGALANRDFFREKDLVPFYEKNKALELRDPKHASRFGKMIQSLAVDLGFGSTGVGKALGDARIVDFLVREHFGILGDIGLEVSNIGRKDTSRRLSAGKLVGVFTGSPVYASRDVQWVYDFAENIGMGSRNKYIENMKSLLDRYHEATTDKDRDRLGAQVRAEAARVRKIFEEMSKDKDVRELKDLFKSRSSRRKARPIFNPPS